MKLDNLHRSVGEIMMNSQKIKHDIKFLYAVMLGGDVKQNHNNLMTTTFEDTVGMLIELDKSKNFEFFSDERYGFLKEVGKMADYWANRAYMEVVLTKDNFEENLSKLCMRAQKFGAMLNEVAEDTEKSRLKAFATLMR